jgi:hypothetical protein
MFGLILLTVGLRPFGTFMEGVINIIIWVTGILASVSYHFFSEGKLVGLGNKACTYGVVALTFLVMFAIVVHMMLGIFSKERIDARKKKTALEETTTPDAEKVMSDAVQMITSREEVIEPPKIAEEAPTPARVEVQVPTPAAEDSFSSLKKYFFDMFKHESKEEPANGEGEIAKLMSPRTENNSEVRNNTPSEDPALPDLLSPR